MKASGLVGVRTWCGTPGLGKMLSQRSETEEESMGIAVGQAAPGFTLQNQEKKEVKLSDFSGKKNVVLVWYPLDWSPTCTNEHACFVNEMKAFETLDAEVLGISVDSVWSQDRKSTRLNSSHGYISYAVFCLKKKKKMSIMA